jgi:hypothetical protein
MERHYADGARDTVDLQKLAAVSRRQRMASGLLERIATHIKEFEAQLDDAHTPGIIVRGDLTLILEQIDFHDAGLVFFIGRDERGRPARVLQHASQVNIALIAVPRRDTEEPKKPIGFALPV